MASRFAAVADAEDVTDTASKHHKRVAIIGSPDKPAAAEGVARLKRWLDGRATLVYAEISFDSAAALRERPDMLFVLGGDGTLISAAHGLGLRQVPIVGVNLGKLGFLADFTVEQIEREGDFLFADPLPLTRRVMLDVSIENGGPTFRSPAVNDCVILAGPPFRLVELAVEVDGETLASIRGDGLIVATASGSTAHNLSAGGPILEPSAASFVLTPICPHALTFRPLVLDAARWIVIRVRQSNDGTHAVIDGRIVQPMHFGDHVSIRRYPADFQLVRNPQHSAWYALRQKLLWGEGPIRR